MRGLNRSIVISAIREHGTLSRADLVRFTSISPASVSAIVSDLIDEGLVREEGWMSSDLGRPGRLLRFADDVLFLGCDLGAAEGFRVGLMRLSGELVESRVLDVPARPLSVDRVARLLTDYVVAATSHFAPARVVGAGVGVPGLVDPTTRRIRIAPLLEWEDAEVDRPLCEGLEMPVFIDNDVALALAAEVDRGAATKARSVILLTFAEGLGGAVLLDGKIYRGRGAAGEVAYMVTDSFAAEGIEHGIGVLEARIFELVAEDARRDGIDPTLYEGQTARLIHQLVRSRGAFQLSEDVSNLLVRTVAAALASSIALLDPEVMLLSGWIELGSQELLDRVIGHARRMVPSMPDIQFSSLGDDRVVIGAALAACRGTLADVQVVEAAI